MFAPRVSPADGPQRVTLQAEAPGVVQPVRTMPLGEGSLPIPGPAAVAPRPGPQGQPGRGANGGVPLALRGEARALYARPAPARPEVLSCVAPAPASIAAPSSS